MIEIRIYNIYRMIIKYDIFSDKMMFILLEMFFIILLIYAISYEIGYKIFPSFMKVIRTEKSQQKLIIAFMILASIVILIFNIIDLDILTGYKLIIVIINLILLFWLTNYSSWFRNKIIGFFNKLQNVEEKH